MSGRWSIHHPFPRRSGQDSFSEPWPSRANSLLVRGLFSLHSLWVICLSFPLSLLLVGRQLSQVVYLSLIFHWFLCLINVARSIERKCCFVLSSLHSRPAVRFPGESGLHTSYLFAPSIRRLFNLFVDSFLRFLFALPFLPLLLPAGRQMDNRENRTFVPGNATPTSKLSNEPDWSTVMKDEIYENQSIFRLIKRLENPNSPTNTRAAIPFLARLALWNCLFRSRWCKGMENCRVLSPKILQGKLERFSKCGGSELQSLLRQSSGSGLTNCRSSPSCWQSFEFSILQLDSFFLSWAVVLGRISSTLRIVSLGPKSRRNPLIKDTFYYPFTPKPQK